jgi:hypothetical protein
MFKTKLMDKTGRVNGPALKYLKDWELELIHEKTKFLDINPKIQLKHRILAIHLNITNHPLCKYCNTAPTSIIPKRKSLFGTFCSDICASNWSRSDISSIEKYKETIPIRLLSMREAGKRGRDAQTNTNGGFGFQRKDIQEKIKSMNICRDPYFWKDWNGYKVQGYENLFLDDRFTENLVIHKRHVPKFDNPTYWPDFYDPTKNILYEIKSAYTLSIGILQSNLIPRLVVASSNGYIIELHLYHKTITDYKSYILTLIPYTNTDEVVSSLKNFLTTIYQDDPYVLHRLGQPLRLQILEWLDAQTG